MVQPKKKFLAKIILLAASSLVAITMPRASTYQHNAEDEDVPGELTMLTNGDWTCNLSEQVTEGNCINSDCNAPNISTECNYGEDDNQTTKNELTTSF